MIREVIEALIVCSFLGTVYDQIIPIVDNTNLFIMGVTVAMAWPLPDKLHRHDEEATHDHQNKTDKIVNDMSKHISFSKQSNESDCYNNCHYDSYYNRRNYHIGLSDRDYRQHLIAKTKLFNTNPWDQNYSSTNTVSSRWYRDSTQLNHYVYPALRMRRDIFLQKQTKMHQNYLHPEVKHYLNQHHASRLSLHSSIEKYLIAYESLSDFLNFRQPSQFKIQLCLRFAIVSRKGENGKQCVERAICETVQRSSTNDAPQSFLKEIMRAIFRSVKRRISIETEKSNHFILRRSLLRRSNFFVMKVVFESICNHT